MSAKRVFYSIEEIEAEYWPELHRQRRLERLPDDLQIYARLFGLEEAEKRLAEREAALICG